MKAASPKVGHFVSFLLGALTVLFALLFLPPHADRRGGSPGADPSSASRGGRATGGGASGGGSGALPRGGSGVDPTALSRESRTANSPAERSAILGDVVDYAREQGIHPSAYAIERARGAGAAAWGEDPPDPDRDLVFEPTPQLEEAMQTVDGMSRAEIVGTMERFSSENAAWLERQGIREPFDDFSRALQSGYTVQSAFEAVFDRYGPRARTAANLVIAEREADYLSSMAKYWGTDRSARVDIYMEKLDTIGVLRDEFRRSFHYR